MFVLSEAGELFVYAIQEIAPPKEDYFSKKRPEFTGQIEVDKAIKVKEMPPLQMIATGVDHLIGLDKKGQVWAMGNDTFGQCGQGGEGR